MKKLHPNLIRHILMFAVILITLIIWVCESTPDKPHAEHGVLDLSRWQWDSSDRISLSGEWEFYWNKFLTSRDFKNNTHSDPILVNVPQTWNHYTKDGKNLPGFGYATYHMKVKVPDTKTVLGVRISSVSTAFQFYVNGRLLAQNGEISTSKEGSKPERVPVTAIFAPPAKEFDIIVLVSNYTYARGGIWFNIDFGTAEQIQRYESYLEYRDGIVIGILAIMAVYFFCYFYMFREDRKNFSFMLMCLILIIRTGLFGDCLIVQLFPGISFRLLVWLAYLTLIWFPVILYQMIEFCCGTLQRRSLSRPFHIYAVISSVITGLAQVSFYTRLFHIIDALAVFIFMSALINAFWAHVKKEPGANVIFTGSVIIGLAGLHDMLYQANLINTRFGELTPIGLILFMFLMFLLMADRFSKTYRKVQSLSEELAEKLKREQDLTERLYTLDKMKDEFLTSTSHELRTPLSGIINITHSVLQGIGGEISDVQRQNLEVVLNSAKKLLRQTNEFLDVSLIRNGGILISPAPLNIQALISNKLAVLHHLKKDETVTLINAIPADFPPIFADEARLRQILSNLLSNALNNTESGTIEVSASHDGKQARICIKDTGSGIAQKKLETIFNAFEQIDGTIQRKQEDAGLGLYITRQLVELHEGKIWITSEAGKGSQVCFTMPLAQKHHAENPVSELKNHVFDFLEFGPEKNDTPYSILAVEDDLPSLQALTNILRLANYNVQGVSSSKDALSHLESGATFELVILDVMMPELCGYEVLERLREKYTRLELPVLMLISKSQNEDMALCYKLGANDYLTKPFEVDELLARVNSLVRLKHAVNKLVATEMSFLQAQIKPHFIHNTLSVISSLSVKDPHKAKALILDLSDYLRGSFELDNDDGLTTLSKELELVRAYLSIEQARFKERLQIRYQLPDDMDCTLPLLSIQPLVENAIRHGIMCRLEGGEIHIAASREQDRIRVEVRDNGVGIDEDRIAKFFELKDQKGVGMANIHRRLMTCFGDGLHIESAPNLGTAVYFYVPYQSGKEVLE